MSYFEDYTRIRVNEAIESGLKSQESARSLGRLKTSPVKAAALAAIGLVILMAVFLALGGL